MLATIARQKLRDIAILEGHQVVPDEKALEPYLASLGSDEDPFKNQILELPSRSRNIAPLFRKEQK